MAYICECILSAGCFFPDLCACYNGRLRNMAHSHGCDATGFRSTIIATIDIQIFNRRDIETPCDLHPPLSSAAGTPDRTYISRSTRPKGCCFIMHPGSRAHPRLRFRTALTHIALQPFTRRLITRLLGLGPSAVVATIYGKRGIDALLVGSQVALSFVLPFVVFPLVWLTSSRAVMRVRVGENKWKDYSNSRAVAALGYAIFFVVVLANGYAIVSLALGQGASG